MSIVTLFATCLWFLLVSSFTGADEEANINCLRAMYSQVKDPNGYWKRDCSMNKGPIFDKLHRDQIFVEPAIDDESRVLAIKLSGYGLTGKFPLGVKECSDLTGLDLSRNNFSGPLPSNIASLIPSVTYLDLSDNSFSGKIPAGLSNITYLNTLLLQHNQFTGQLPPQLGLLRRLSKFSVTDNLLSGPIPKFNESFNFELESFADNVDLCGWPLDICIDSEEDMIRFGKIGAAIGAAVFAPVSVFLDWFFFNSRKEKQGDIRRRS